MRAVFALVAISGVAVGGAWLADWLAPQNAGGPPVAESLVRDTTAPLPVAPRGSIGESDHADAPALPPLTQKSDADLAMLARGDGPLAERRAALEQLTFRHSPDLLDAAVVALGAPEPKLRAAASSALETLGDPRAVSALRRAYEAEHEPTVRRTMALALRSLDQSAAP